MEVKDAVNRRFDVSNIILKIEVVYANVKVSVNNFDISINDLNLENDV